MREFGYLVQNEWIKLFRRRRFLVVLILALGLVGVFTFAERSNYKAQVRNADPSFQKQMMENNIANLEVEMNRPNLPKEEKSSLEESLKSMRDELKTWDTRKPPHFDEAAIRQQMDEVKKNMDSLPPDQQFTKGNYELNLMMLQWKLDHGIPTQTGNTLPLVTFSTWEAVKDFLNIGPAVFIPLLAVLLVSDIISGEQTGGTIKLLLTRPASRGKILFAKYTTSVLSTLLVNALLFAVLLGAGALLFGVGNAQDPVEIGVKYITQTQMVGGMVQPIQILDVSHAHLIGESAYVFCSMGLTLLSSIAMCTLGFFCSVLVRSAAVSTGLAMGIVIIGSVIANVGRGMSWTKPFLTTHFNLPLAWTGRLTEMTGVSTTLTQSTLILAAWTVVLYVIGHFLFKRRDILA